MRIGRYEARAVRTATFRLDGGAMFGIVPRAVWEKEAPPDAQNRVTLALRCLLLQGADRTILVDTGIGDKGGAKFDERFAVTTPTAGPAAPPSAAAAGPQTSRLARALGALGVEPEQVTDCVLTHLHWDHAGGATVPAPGGGLVPQFPRARYYVQRAHHAWAQAPSERDQGSFRREDWEALADRLVLLDGPGEILPGLHARLSGGHTPGLQLVHVCAGERDGGGGGDGDGGGDGGLVYCADLVPTSHHLRPSWVMGYDLFPATGVREKRALREEAARRRWMLFFEHDPDVDAATVRWDGDRPVVDQVFAL